jgi:hypothetical protein
MSKPTEEELEIIVPELEDALRCPHNYLVERSLLGWTLEAVGNGTQLLISKRDALAFIEALECAEAVELCEVG